MMTGVSGFEFEARGYVFYCFSFMYIYNSLKNKKNKIFDKLNKKAEVISPG
nr:MAG TPA: hypothetical protein [Caudoviricetes sp.]